PNPVAGEWQPPQVLSECRPPDLSNHSSRPRSASCRLTGRPSRCGRLSSTRPVNPAACKAAVNCLSRPSALAADAAPATSNAMIAASDAISAISLLVARAISLSPLPYCRLFQAGAPGLVGVPASPGRAWP